MTAFRFAQRAAGARRLRRAFAAIAALWGAFNPLAAQATRDSTRAARDTVRSLEGVTVRAIRWGDDAPVSQSTLGPREIEQRNLGQDIPLLLQGTPSLTIKSETGSPWGYSYVRLRGMEHRRLNFTMDGIPLNDPEDHVLYFADFPDLSNSIQSVQVQRGVGTSSAGVAAYAGSVNLETVSLAGHPRALDVQLQAGAFASRRGSVEYHSGLLPSRLAFYGRGSALTTDGYRRHAGIDGRSLFLSGGWFGDRDIVKLTYTAGSFADTMAYTGATLAQLNLDRRHNPLNPAERDEFGERLLSVAYTRALGVRSSIATTVYRIAAAGDFDVCLARCDSAAPGLQNFNLDFAWLGVTSAWSWSGDGLRISAGGNANTYARDHSAYARPNLTTPLYFNTGHKRDVSGFVKAARDVGALTLFGDLQLRAASFRYTPDANAGIAGLGMDWSFVNPKGGITWHIASLLSAYASYGVHTREPGREDMFAGFDNVDMRNVAFVGTLDRIRPERVRDLEAGLRMATTRLSAAVNLFDMRFEHEILPIGVLSNIGTPLRKNVPQSRRRGVELDAAIHALPSLQLGGNATLMTSRIAEYTNRQGMVFRDVPALLTPRFMSAQRITWSPARALSLGVEGRYAGASQLTNADDPSLVLPATWQVDASITAQRGRHRLTLFGNNLGNSRGYSTGNVSSSGRARYFVLAPLNLHLLAQVVY